MAYFPLFVDLEGRTVLLIGGGAVASRRTASLSDFGCSIMVISPELHQNLQEMEKSGRIIWKRKAYEASDLTAGKRPFFVLAAGPEHVNQQVTADCKRLGIPVNDASQKENCDFYFPGLVKDGETVIGITSGGGDHKLAAALSALVREFMRTRREKENSSGRIDESSGGRAGL